MSSTNLFRQPSNNSLAILQRRSDLPLGDLSTSNIIRRHFDMPPDHLLKTFQQYFDHHQSSSDYISIFFQPSFDVLHNRPVVH
ncbi:unnamed protein product [Ilex paraguariensis]|uniref:Uncharacterized protein n=1 Tax=Ilex paraguariensis TaxID=185542 RepID=A0ABC8TQA1_9AQUA